MLHQKRSLPFRPQDMLVCANKPSFLPSYSFVDGLIVQVREIYAGFLLRNKSHVWKLQSVLFFINFILRALASVVSVGDFNKDFYITWAPDHVNTSTDGRERGSRLDQQSGSAFASNSMFLFGQIDMQIKLILGNSAGTVVAYYLTSDQPNRDELDFEFLGNVSGHYILQTNVFADGSDDREQQIFIHTLSCGIFIKLCLWWSGCPSEFIETMQTRAFPYPRWQPMGIKASLWNGDSWATRGGQDKVDWTKGPFIASFSNYKIDACLWRGNPSFCRAASTINWWNKPAYRTLTNKEVSISSTTCNL